MYQRPELCDVCDACAGSERGRRGVLRRDCRAYEAEAQNAKGQSVAPSDLAIGALARKLDP